MGQREALRHADDCRLAGIVRQIRPASDLAFGGVGRRDPHADSADEGPAPRPGASDWPGRPPMLRADRIAAPPTFISRRRRHPEDDRARLRRARAPKPSPRAGDLTGRLLPNYREGFSALPSLSQGLEI